MPAMAARPAASAPCEIEASITIGDGNIPRPIIMEMIVSQDT